MNGLTSTRLSFAAIPAALRDGWRLFRAVAQPSVVYTLLFVVLGAAVLTAIGLFGLSPLVLPFAGGFMLVGPVLLTGYFELAARTGSGARPTAGDALRAFRRAPRGLWLIALVCAFLFLIWITDVGILYSFTLGGEHLGYAGDWLPTRGSDVLRFELWGALMGGGLAFMIFTVSAFSVPLLHDGRASAVAAIHASVRAVFANLPVCLSWGAILTLVVVPSILLLPLLMLTLPVMAYASHALYRRAFPAPGV